MYPCNHVLSYPPGQHLNGFKVSLQIGFAKMFKVLSMSFSRAQIEFEAVPCLTLRETIEHV